MSSQQVEVDLAIAKINRLKKEKERIEQQLNDIGNTETERESSEKSTSGLKQALEEIRSKAKKELEEVKKELEKVKEVKKEKESAKESAKAKKRLTEFNKAWNKVWEEMFPNFLKVTNPESTRLTTTVSSKTSILVTIKSLKKEDEEKVKKGGLSI